MNPRIVFRTHYQIHEPAYLKLLILLCASPVQSNYREVVAERLAREITRRNRPLNTPAGGYAVDLAQDLGLLTPNNSWADKGHLLNLTTQIRGEQIDEELHLTLPEKLLFFNIFLEGDGAGLLFIAKRLLSGGIADSDATWNNWARDMFTAVYSEYLEITTNTADRVRLRRKIDRIRSQGYEGNTGSHKIFIHIQTLYRLGLVTRSESAGAHSTRLPHSSDGRAAGLEVLVEKVPTVLALEKAVLDHQWAQVAAEVFGLPHRPLSVQHENAEDILEILAPIYRRVMSTGISLCPLSALLDAAQIHLLSARSELLAHQEAIELLTTIQRRNPKQVRFHVNRQGHPAFLRLAPDLLAAHSQELPS